MYLSLKFLEKFLYLECSIVKYSKYWSFSIAYFIILRVLLRILLILIIYHIKSTKTIGESDICSFTSSPISGYWKLNCNNYRFNTPLVSNSFWMFDIPCSFTFFLGLVFFFEVLTTVFLLIFFILF